MHNDAQESIALPALDATDQRVLNSPGNPSVALPVAQWESIALRLRESGLPSVAPPTMQRLDMTANCNEHRAAFAGAAPATGPGGSY